MLSFTAKESQAPLRQGGEKVDDTCIRPRPVYYSRQIYRRITMKSLVSLLALLITTLNAAAEFRAAMATRVVTPDPLLPVIGGVGPGNLPKGKAGELTVRALVFDDGGTRVAICSVDFLGFPGPLCDKIRAAVKDIPAKNILIGSTHTHSAPDCYGFPNGKGGTAADMKYIESVCARLAEAINEAAGKLQPATLKIATGEAKGKIAYNYYADQLYDPRCHVIQALDKEGKALATLVNYAVHPEVLGSDAGFCSPDLVGPLYDELAAKGGGVGLFMNSAQGGMVTADNRRPEGRESRSWEECQRIGTLLANEALRIVRDAPLQTAPKIYCAARPLTFPVESPLMRALLKALPNSPGANVESMTTQFNLLNIGNAQILSIPGEALPNIGYYLKRKMRGEHNLLFGLTNDAYGYMLTKEDFNSFKRYNYISQTSLGERTGEILVNEALKFVNDSPKPEGLAAK